MKKLKILLIFTSLIAIIVYSCERDDICPEDTLTTPHLVLEFYNVSNQENIKTVVNLRIQGIDNDNVLPGYTGNGNITEVLLPLKTNANSTQFRFHKNYGIDNNDTPNDPDDDFITGNEDIVTINYTTENVYVSRACGYKTIFKNVSISVDNDADRWITLVQAVTDNQTIENETTTHYNFFH